MTGETHGVFRASYDFQKASEQKPPTRHLNVERPKSRPAPFSVRYTAEELTLLRERAGNKPLGAYIRQCTLGDLAVPRRKSHRPHLDDQKLAEVMSELGRSRLSSNLNQLNKSIHVGTLHVSDDVEQQLEDACAAVIALRDALYVALGLRGGGTSDVVKK